MFATTDPAFLRAAEAIAVLGGDLDRRGWSPATSGNYSVRLDGTCCAITASGRDKGCLTKADILLVDFAGQVQGEGQSSAETLLHTSLYQRSGDIGAVLHTHSSASTALGLLRPGQTDLVLEGYELLKAFAGVATHEVRLGFPIVENTQDIAALAAEVITRLDAAASPCFGYLIRGHGTYAWGRDLAEARRHLDAIEFLLDCELRRTGAGGCH
jgi:methylthioribulose-1-phosphate dehydratase